jgi:dipeptidyl aminopeptidase/acylaminoacyl peptidase
MIALAAALLHSMVPVAPLPHSGEDPCRTFDQEVVQPGRFGAQDQATLADLGASDLSVASPFVGISPDRAWIAFVVIRANPALNAYCQRLVVLPIAGDGAPMEVDRGGEFIRDDYPLRHFASVKAGWAKPNQPRFSPDGTKVAYLKRVGGSTQVWVADPLGKAAARKVTSLPDDVDRFAWSDDGAGFIVESRPAIRLRAQAIADEAASGFLFDERFSPQIASHPIPIGETQPAYSFTDLAGAAVRPASSAETRLLAPSRPSGVPEQARTIRLSGDGSLAWLQPERPDRLIGPSNLVVRLADGQRMTCGTKERCASIRDLWWSEDGKSLVLLRASGWANSVTSLLRWDAERPDPEVLLETEDVLVGCVLDARELLCGREGASQPRRLVAFDITTGAERVVFDPNPRLANAEFGTVGRLRFRNAFGTESFADLVLPPTHQHGDRHPLVVVQYNSEGFLRGGTGDEVPIHALANRGFAVLSFDRPAFAPAALQARTAEELRRTNRLDWLDRRNVQSSLEAAIALALETGTVDRDRMGISGFSDGGSTVQWSLINSDLFRAASMGSCCEDLYSFPTAAGPGFTDFARDMGYKYFEPGVEKFWKPMSLILNVGQVTVPILIQSADSEYEGGLDVVETYSHAGRPIELHIFPDETHIKWQPAHRLAVYERTIDWFEFWLRKRVDCSPRKASQYERWLRMAGAPPTEGLTCIDTGPSDP